MKAITVINAVNGMRPNSIDADQKAVWLARCDELIYIDVIKRHEGAQTMRPFKGTTQTQAEDEDLMIGEPYRALYEHYLMAQIDLINGDTAKYNNDVLLFNDALGNFTRAWHREHMPLAAPKFRV